jgi:hypothetical protein
MVGAAILAACGKGTAQPGAEKSAVVGAVAFPAETRAVIGIDVARVRGSAVAVRAVRAVLDRDPETRAKLDGLFTRCQIDPGADLKKLTLGMGGPEDVAVVVVGDKMDEAKIVACFGQTSTVTTQGRRYASTSKDGQTVFFAFGGEPSLILATSDAWLAKVMDPTAPKLAGAMAARLAQVSPEAAVWGAGELPPGVGAKLVELSRGQLAAPATAIRFEVDLATGVLASLSAEMQTPADADKLAALVKSQLDWAVVAAQRWGLSRLVARAQVRSESNVVRVSLRLDEKQLEELAAAFDGKEQKQ